MDPETALANAREAWQMYLHPSLRPTNPITNRPAENSAYYAEEALRAFAALDEWLTKGGFLPADWRSRHDKLSARAQALLIDKYGVDPETINGRP